MTQMEIIRKLVAMRREMQQEEQVNQQRNEIRVIIENDRGFKWYGVTFSPWGLQDVMRELTKEYMRRVVLESKGARDPWGRGGDAKPEEPTDVGEQ